MADRTPVNVEHTEEEKYRILADRDKNPLWVKYIEPKFRTSKKQALEVIMDPDCTEARAQQARSVWNHIDNFETELRQLEKRHGKNAGILKGD